VEGAATHRAQCCVSAVGEAEANWSSTQYCLSTKKPSLAQHQALVSSVVVQSW
jgi:hypothetical protein